MHDGSVILAGKEIACAAHIRGKLIDFVKSAIYYGTYEVRVTEISDDEVTGFGIGMLMQLDIHASYPHAFASQTLDQMAANEPTRSAYKCCFRHAA